MVSEGRHREPFVDGKSRTTITLSVENNNWYYSSEHGQLCQVIETQTLWGETVCRVWLPGKCRTEL